MEISAGWSHIPAEPHVERAVLMTPPIHEFVESPYRSMQLAEFLDCDAIKPALPGGNKRSLLKQLADLAAQRLGLEAGPVLAAINEREQLGSTGFGQGVAIPHAKVDGLDRIHG